LMGSGNHPMPVDSKSRVGPLRFKDQIDRFPCDI
jgi:hypothetical protein